MSQPQKTATLAGLLLLCLTFAVGAGAKQKDAPSYGTPLSAIDKQHFLNDNFTVIKTVAAIPKSVQSQIMGTGMGAGMAEPGQPFQEGDVIYKPLPFQRLVFAGTSTGYCFVCSEHGGYGHWTWVSLYHLLNNKAILVWRGSPEYRLNISDLSQLRSAIIAGKITGEQLPK